ncbi:hypothetical protein N0V88_006624 [Collariella sp. IMI 366227]|nr:hypothetical protein N0V88_006624 [Collariella sp. IMI 366227]
MSRPPKKRARLQEVKDIDAEDENPSDVFNAGSGEALLDLKRATSGDPLSDNGNDREPLAPKHETAFESSLAAVATDRGAIEEYEVMRASQASQAYQASPDNADSASARLENRQWVRGKSSIYVDAFNLALDTVLEDEADLFDDKEKSVFEQWRALSYEAQFLWTMEEAASLLGLDELKALAKEFRVQGKNKADLLKAFCRASSQQSGLVAVGLRRSSINGTTESGDSPRNQDSNRNAHFLHKILAITGPLIRLSGPVFTLFERVHLVFYRSTEWTEKSLTTIILAKIARRNYPEYIVCRSSNIFASRRHILEFELSMRKEFEVDSVLEFNGPPGEEGFSKILDVFESIASRWRELIKEENDREDHVYEFGEGGYLRRFNPGHAFTRIAHKAAHVLGRLHKYPDEHALLTELLDQRLFHPARRGFWYQRKALVEERYMWEADPDPVSADPEVRKKHWQRIAVTTCETALEDRDCHLIYHYNLQKRLVKLEKKLRVPRRLQHDFGHVKLREPEEHTVQGVQLVRDDPDTKGKLGRGHSTKTIWLDELGDPGEDGQPLHVSVEDMCLSHYRSQGWKGYHSEGGILRTLFAYLFFDVLFVYVPSVFQTAYQTCPLDLHTDAFYLARASQINHRLVEIENGEAARILWEVHVREHERRTCVVGLNWDFDVEDLVELVSCFDGGALAAVCKVMAQEYKARGGGVPDLILWRAEDDGRKGEVMFSEVKSANDRLSDTQRLWINVLTGAGVRVALCNAVAREVKMLG